MQDIIRLDDNKTIWSPISDIKTPKVSYQQTPICQCPFSLSDEQPLVLSLLSIGLFLDMSHIPFVLFHHTQPPLLGFIFSLKLCAPLVHSFPDSSSDISLFISLTAPLLL